VGGSHDSLRDALSSMMSRLTGRNGHASDEQDFWALRDVNFEVRQGETLGMIGHNGAGKSTVLKLLSKISTQTKGKIALRGRLAALIELGGGFHPDLSGRENIYLQGTMLGLTRRQIVKSFDSIVAFSELERFLEMPVKRYSSGMTVRLGFAIAAHVQPEILLLDEVLAVGDLAFQQKCFQRIAELKDLGTTMIFISHNLEAVHKLCDRVVLLANGQVLGDGDPTAMIRRYRDEVFANSRQRRQRAEEADGRRRNDDVVIGQLALRGPGGVEVDRLLVGQALQVDIPFRMTRPIAQPLFRVALERVDGLVCHVATHRPPELTGDAAEGTVTLHYPSIPLTPNLYHVIVDVFEANSPIAVGSSGRGRLFEIASDGVWQGAIAMDHSWTVSLASEAAPRG
jgi:ABC-type polysaccharide/polyol phosphate transport system ATPase subunit